MVFSQIPTPCRSYTKADKGFAKNFDFKDVKEMETLEMEKRTPSTLVLLVMNIEKNIQSMYQKNIVKTSMLIYCLYEKKTNGTIFLSIILIRSCMITQYIVEKSIFTVIVYKLPVP